MTIRRSRFLGFLSVLVWLCLTPPAPAAESVPDPVSETSGFKSTASLAFDVAQAMAHVQKLAGEIGPRVAASPEERRAGDYLLERLRELGYFPATQAVRLPSSVHSRNVMVTLPGESSDVLVVGAHYDSKAGSPGGNDNASGTAILLELARILSAETPPVTLRLIFFGAEETIDSNPDHHHFGSRAYVAALLPSEQRRLKGMISVDMVGYGPDFHVRTMGEGPMHLARLLLTFAHERDFPLTYLRDPGETGWSDHEPFELIGVAAAWLQWRDDPAYHTPRDTAEHVSTAHLQTTGDLLAGFLRDLSAGDLLFHDVPPSTSLRSAILDLYERGLLSGYTDNTFRPDNPLIRAQFAKIAVLLLNAAVDESLEAPFHDLADDPTETLYPHDYAAAAARDGLVKGFADGTFRPWQNLSRAQAVTIAVRALLQKDPSRLTLPPPEYAPSWEEFLHFAPEHRRNAALAEYNGLLDGLDLSSAASNPWLPMPRGEAALLLSSVSRLLDLGANPEP